MVALGAFLSLLTLIALTLKLDNPGVSGGKILGWDLFSFYGILLDQGEFPVTLQARSGFRGLTTGLLVTSIVLAFVLNNSYRAVLNVNYVTGNELLCPWRRLDQLMNFSVLYVPAGSCLWNRIESLPGGERQMTKA